MPPNNPNINFEPFNSLKAEHEQSWLYGMYVPPPFFELIKQQRSSIIIGERGSGKSMLCRILQTEAQSHQLPIIWYPTLLVDERGPSYLVDAHIVGIFAACAEGLLGYIAHHPMSVQQAPTWVQDLLTWFIQQFLQANLAWRVQMLRDECPGPGQDLLAELAHRPPLDLFPANIAPQSILTELCKALKEYLHIDNVLILVDGLEAWLTSAEDRLTDNLSAFLNALELFEQRGFYYKIFAPQPLLKTVGQSRAVQTRRVEVQFLAWQTPHLVALVEKRLAMASHGAIQKLGQLCNDSDFVSVIERVGAQSPGGWLEYVRAIVAALAYQNAPKLPLTRKQIAKIYRSVRPQLIVDNTNSTISVGRRTITRNEIPDSLLKIFDHLYACKGTVCPKEAIYHTVYTNGNNQLPTTPNELEVIDNFIWRLRQLIEPDPRYPAYIITRRRKGIILENAL